MLGDQDPTYELLAEKSMPYLNGVIMECLRLHPPVYVLLQRWLCRRVLTQEHLNLPAPCVDPELANKLFLNAGWGVLVGKETRMTTTPCVAYCTRKGTAKKAH